MKPHGTLWRVTQAGLGDGREPSERQSSFFGQAPGPEFG